MKGNQNGMASCLAGFLVFVLMLMNTKCAVFNHVATVTKARCHANCLTEVSDKWKSYLM